MRVLCVIGAISLLALSCRTANQKSSGKDIGTDIGSMGSGRSLLYYTDRDGGKEYVVRAHCPLHTVDFTRAACQAYPQKVLAERLKLRMQTTAGASVPRYERQVEDVLTAAYKIGVKLEEMASEEAEGEVTRFSESDEVIAIEAEIANSRTEYEDINDQIVMIELALRNRFNADLEVQLLDLYRERNAAFIKLKDFRRQLSAARRLFLNNHPLRSSLATSLLSRFDQHMNVDLPKHELELMRAMGETDLVDPLLNLVRDQFIWPVVESGEEFSDIKPMIKLMHEVFASLLKEDPRISLESRYLDVDRMAKKAEIATPFENSRLLVFDKYLMAYGGSGIVFYDITEPSAPRVAATSPLLGLGCVVADTVICAVSDSGEGRRHENVRFAKLEVEGEGVSVNPVGNTADQPDYVYQMSKIGNEIFAFDMSSVYIMSLDSGEISKVSDIYISGDTALLGNRIFEADDDIAGYSVGPMNEVNQISSYRAQTTYSSIYGHGDLLFLTGAEELGIYDISNPDLTVKLGVLPQDYRQNYDTYMLTIGDRLLASNQTLKVIDISDPKHPSVVRVIDDGDRDLAVAQNHLFLLGKDKLSVYSSDLER